MQILAPHVFLDPGHLLIHLGDAKVHQKGVSTVSKELQHYFLGPDIVVAQRHGCFGLKNARNIKNTRYIWF